MTTRRRWGLLTTGYPHAGDLVAGSFVRSMARALAARGDGVCVVCAGRRGDEPVRDEGVGVTSATYAWGETFYGAGAPDALGLGGTSGRWRAWAGVPGVVLSLGWEARRGLGVCDVLVSHFALPCGVLAAVVRGARPHVMVVHGTDGWLLARLPRAVQQRVLRGATVVWYTHAALREAVAHPEGVACVVRPMGWETSPASPHSLSGEGGPERGGIRDVVRLVVVSRLVPVKRVGRAIEAVRELVGRGRIVSLVVMGDGPERAALEAMAGANVSFLGGVDAKTRDRVLAESDVFLHVAGELSGGRTEGAPVAVLEAMGAGLPVVACDAGGVREMVGDAGVIVGDDASPAEIADAVERAIAEREELSRRARERAWPLRWEATAAWMETLVERRR